MNNVVVLSTILLGAICTQNPGGRPVSNGLIFRASFDGSVVASPAGGNGHPVVASGITYAKGVVRQAVRISPDSRLEYVVPGNLVQEHGTVMLWFKPNWRAADMGMDWKDWHCLFSEPLPDGTKRTGSGSLWLWFWGSMLRGDISDAADQYKTAGSQGLDSSRWAHVALTWDVNLGSRLYMNGMEVGSAGDGASPLIPVKSGAFAGLRNRFATFTIGSQGASNSADGLIDEFKIYDRALSRGEIEAEMAEVAPFRVECLAPLPIVQSDFLSELKWTLKNVSRIRLDGNCRWKFAGPDGHVIAQGNDLGGAVDPGAKREVGLPVFKLAQGEYDLAVQPTVGPVLSTKVWVLSGENPVVKPSGKIDATLVEKIDFTKGVPSNRYVVRGETRKGSLAGRPYFEAGLRKNDRFAVNVTLPEPGVPYLVEWDYPDDKLRTMEMVAQDALSPANDYSLQTGMFCGGEFPNSMQTLTHRSIYWAKSKQTAFIFMTARENAPVAVSELRISKIVGGLPDRGIRDADPVAGWTRTIGIHFEDPALGYDFGIDGQMLPQYEKTVDRLVAYMKWTGQNFLSYPAVWYQGRIGPSYQPRVHEDDFIGCILAKFEPNGLGFMPTINLHNIALDSNTVITEKSVADGSLHQSAVMILANGKPNPGGFHGTPPNFNPLHPSVQGYIDSQIDDLLNRYSYSRAFKGVVLHLTKHTIPWFGSIEAGYNDYCIEAFEKQTGIHIPVDHRAPLRGKLYYDWLMDNAREKWVDWRCQQIAHWYKTIANRLSARRADLKLSICSYNPTVTDFGDDPRYGKPGFSLTINKESGFDPSLFEGVPNIIVDQTVYPADYRWGGAELSASHPGLSAEQFQQGTYAILRKAEDPWVNMHDRYFEDGIGGQNWWGKTDPLVADWLHEVPWRVSVLNPNSSWFLEQYILPLRFGDVLGYSKGGFSIGTAGVEDQLAEFARAFRALPATRFSPVSGSTESVIARTHRSWKTTWFYVVNTGRAPTHVTLGFNSSPGAVFDVGGGSIRKTSGSTLDIQLKRYELRSFRYQGSATLKSISVK